MRNRVLLMVIASAMLATSSTPVGAQPAPPPEDAAATREGARTRSRRALVSGEVVALEGDTIVGRVPKPQVFYVLGRSEKRYRGLGVRRSFVRRIVDTLKRNPL